MQQRPVGPGCPEHSPGRSPAHDCITLFLGSKERYLDYFQTHPGVYFKTSGWIERGEGLTQYRQDSIHHLAGMTQTYEELVAKYGEDNAKFLYDQLCNMTRNYSGLTFIEMGIEPDGRFEDQAREQAAERGWKFEKVAGDMALIQQLVDGPWDGDRFLVVPPGGRVAASYDEKIIKVVPASGVAAGLPGLPAAGYTCHHGPRSRNPRVCRQGGGGVRSPAGNPVRLSRPGRRHARQRR